MTDAEKRERVIKGLERVSNDIVDGYITEPDMACNTINDAISMLKAQEPRVMTLEEFVGAQKTPVWRETKRAHKNLYNGWMLAYDIQRGQGITGTRQGMTEPNGRVGWYKLDDYGKTWRCWTSRPTDVQREATPWS